MIYLDLLKSQKLLETAVKIIYAQIKGFCCF